MGFADMVERSTGRLAHGRGGRHGRRWAVVWEGSIERVQGFSMAVWIMGVGNVKEEY